MVVVFPDTRCNTGRDSVITRIRKTVPPLGDIVAATFTQPKVRYSAKRYGFEKSQQFGPEFVLPSSLLEPMFHAKTLSLKNEVMSDISVVNKAKKEFVE